MDETKTKTETETTSPTTSIEPHRYVPTGMPHWRICDRCGRGANQEIHRV